MNELIRVTRRCNNRCVFCGSAAPPDVAADEDPAAVLRALRALRDAGARRVVLTGGEPTVAAALSLAVAAARSLGFAEIALKTNGRRLADGGYADRLVQGGLTHALVSLPSHVADVHDALTRTPGSFAEATDGILALCARGVRVTAVLALTRQSAHDLRAYLDLVKALGAGAVSVRSVVAAASDAAPGDDLRLTAAEAAPLVRAALAYGAAQGLRMTSVGLPRAALDVDLRYYH